jgi:hypothetical protein
MAAGKSNLVSDIHGDQIQVDGQWFHAERVFGKPASQYVVGQPVEQLAHQVVAEWREPDEFVSCGLYRGCSSNEMSEQKVAEFAEAMLQSRGWGAFPMISGYIETLDADDVAQCEALVAEGRSFIWLNEMGWSRIVTLADIGVRYVHIDNGHHRVAAAALVSRLVLGMVIPVADRRLEESQPRFSSMRP